MPAVISPQCPVLERKHGGRTRRNDELGGLDADAPVLVPGVRSAVPARVPGDGEPDVAVVVGWRDVAVYVLQE